MNPNTFAAVMGFFGLIGYIAAGLSWYDARVIKSYAAKQDFKKLSGMLTAQSLRIEELEKQDQNLNRILLDLIAKESGETPSQIMERLERKK